MTFSNETNIVRAAQLRLCALIVPHEAFKAACYAVSDQLEVEKRRQRSPLLCHVINSFHSDPVCLVVEPFFSEDFPGVDAAEFMAVYGKCKNELSDTDMETISSNSELHNPAENTETRLQKTISLLQAKDIKNKDKIKELDDIVSELRNRLNLAEKERTEMQKEIDRLRQERIRSTTPKQCIRCRSTFHADALSCKGSKETVENEEVQVRNPNESIRAQLYHLQERRKKLLEASKQTSLNSHHTNLITKIEKAIQLIHNKIGLSNP
jgi:CII-binding regulator of phage lambda lysogenization HflD